MFLISRIIALKEVLKHDYPLVIDGFREGEVATPTEKRIADYLTKMDCQFIITATLKNEEYHEYDNDNRMNKIDLSNVVSKHLLNQQYVKEYFKKISQFNLVI